MKKLALVLGGVLLVFLVASFSLFILSVKVNVNVTNEYQGVDLKQSRLWTNVFLWKEGFWGEVKEINLTYSQTPQNGWQIVDGQDGRLLQSVGLEKVGKSWDITAYYDPQKIDQIVSDKYWLRRDYYAYLCRLSDKKYGKDECSQMSKEFVLWWDKLNVRSVFEFIKGKLSDLLAVSEAYAACSGTIYCGEWIIACNCTGYTGYFCNSDGDDCGPGNIGTCSCATTPECNESAGLSLDCAARTNGIQCEITSGLDCNIGGECPLNQTCNWDCGECGDFGSCLEYEPQNLCIKEGTDDCGIYCNDNCTPDEACVEEFCPVAPGGCGYPGGYVNGNDVFTGDGCECAEKYCPPVVCASPTPTLGPTPAITCRIQGIKVIPVNVAAEPAASQTVTVTALNEANWSSILNPYFYFYSPAGKTRNVSVSVPTDYGVGYTLCPVNSIGCHRNTPVSSSSASANPGFSPRWTKVLPQSMQTLRPEA